MRKAKRSHYGPAPPRSLPEALREAHDARNRDLAAARTQPGARRPSSPRSPWRWARRLPGPRPARRGAGTRGAARADDPARQPYQASLGAADGALRLHETDQCRRWLELAPAELRGFEGHHLARQRDRSSARYAVHGQALTDLAESADGRDLYAQLMDDTVRVLRGAPRPE